MSTNPTTDAGNNAGTPLTDDFCQWCYDKGLRYSRPGPWGHAIECPHNPHPKEPTIADLQAQLTKSREATAQAERERAELRKEKSISIANLCHADEKIAELQAYILKLANLLGCKDDEDSPELGIKDLIADRAALREKLAKAEKAMKSQERYLGTLKCWCYIANEAGDVDRCGTCWALAEIEEAIKGIECTLRGNDKAEKGAGE